MEKSENKIILSLKHIYFIKNQFTENSTETYMNPLLTSYDDHNKKKKLFLKKQKYAPT